LCCTSHLPVTFFWIIHKVFGFVGEVAIHLLLGLAIKNIQKSKRKIMN
jgi:hypothetical protein